MAAQQTSRRRAVLGLLVSLTTVLIVVGVALGLEARKRRQTPSACAQVDVDYARDFRRLSPCMRKVRRSGQDYLLSSRDQFTDESKAGFPLRKTPGVKRIAVIGESSGDLFGGTLQHLLLQSCGEKFEVMNCADTAGALEDVERKWEEVRDYSPDVTVLIFGHNISFERPQSGVKLAVESVAARSCLAVTQMGFRPRGITEGEMPARLTHFDAFLNLLGKETREIGSTLVVNSMAGNLWKVPFPSAEQTVLEARYLSAAHGRPKAIEYLQQQGSTDGPMVDFLLGEQLARDGQLASARSHFLTALEKDTDRSRAPSAVNEHVRQFAMTSGVLLRDTEKAVAEDAPDHLPGWESFIDNCHLTPPRIEQEARAITDMLLPKWSAEEMGDCPQKIRSMPPGYSEEAAPQPPMLRTLRGASNLCRTSRDHSWCLSLALAVERRLRGDFAATDTIIRNFLASDEWHNGSGREALPHIAAGYAAAGYEARAQELLHGPEAETNASVWAQRGLFELTRGQKDDAAKSWARALSIEPQHPAATHWSKRLQDDRGVK